MEGTKLHPVREVRGWVFDPAEVAEVKLTRMAPRPAAPADSAPAFPSASDPASNPAFAYGGAQGAP